MHVMSIVEYISEMSKKNKYNFEILGDYEILCTSGIVENNIEPIISAHEPELGYAVVARTQSTGLYFVIVPYEDFQMTGLELGVIKISNLYSIIVFMNNNCYERLRIVNENRKIYNTTDWGFRKITANAGIQSARESEIDRPDAIIRKVQKSYQAVLLMRLLAIRSLLLAQKN